MEKYKQFKSVEEGREWGDRLYSNWSNKIKNKKYILFKICKKIDKKRDYDSPKDIINQYLGERYQHINSYLRFGKKDKNINVKYLAKIMSRQIANAPKLNENIIFYRYLDCNTLKNIETCRKDKPFIDKGFMSTSLTNIRSKPNEDNTCLLKIFADKGSQGAYTHLMGTETSPGNYEHYYEQEFTFQKGSKLYPLGKIYEIKITTPSDDDFTISVLDCHLTNR
ncbi:ADP-ribosyltransferase [Vagococcus carniphilus]|uniref:ADP ribosyltransferase domain-containing protein n=1 Tax=Vagococcus carniphilus TaxID=218144 RepID=A0A430B8J6_9ENTE|nr:ADP-ribosyltransferase [Vagococcus carniphilus]RSU16578.1 hypothetical protein CBF28_03360 [Vagococcus carniphilus]